VLRYLTVNKVVSQAVR